MALRQRRRSIPAPSIETVTEVQRVKCQVRFLTPSGLTLGVDSMDVLPRDGILEMRYELSRPRDRLVVRSLDGGLVLRDKRPETCFSVQCVYYMVMIIQTLVIAGFWAWHTINIRYLYT